MKNIKISTYLVLASLAFSLLGCLKDKGFENYQYGINDPDTQPPGIGFPLGFKSKNDYGLNASSSPQDVEGLVFVKLNAGNPASTDVSVTMVDSTTAMTASYNALNQLTGTSAILPMPSVKYTVPLTLTIPAGGVNVQVPINVANTTGLDPNRRYGLGLQIKTVSSGYTIATNMSRLFIVFSIKNKYDGRYRIRAVNYHPSLNPTFTGFETTVEMHTTGPNSVKIYMPSPPNPFAGYYHPAWLGGLSAFGSQEPEFTVNPTTNAVTVQNVYPGAVTFYVMMPGFNNAGYNSRWDDAAKTMYACWGYGQGPGNTFVLGASRAWIDTLVRTGPR